MQHMSAYKCIIGSDSGLSPILRQFLLGANFGLLTNLTPREIFNDTLIETQKCSFWKKKNAPENVVCRMAAILSPPQSVDSLLQGCKD